MIRAFKVSLLAIGIASFAAMPLTKAGPRDLQVDGAEDVRRSVSSAVFVTLITGMRKTIAFPGNVALFSN